MTADTPEIGAQRRTLVQGFVAAHGVGHMSTARTIDVRPRVSGVRWLSLLQNVDLHTAFVRIRKRDPAATLSPLGSRGARAWTGPALRYGVRGLAPGRARPSHRPHVPRQRREAEARGRASSLRAPGGPGSPVRAGGGGAGGGIPFSLTRGFLVGFEAIFDKANLCSLSFASLPVPRLLKRKLPLPPRLKNSQRRS